MPRKQRHMDLGGPRLEAMTKIADFWIEKELVKEGVSPWSSPAFPVAKKGNRWRGVVDFRWLNENTLSDGYPLPRIEDILATMGRKMIFTVLDLKDAFHQVPMHPDSRSATATDTTRKPTLASPRTRAKERPPDLPTGGRICPAGLPRIRHSILRRHYHRQRQIRRVLGGHHSRAQKARQVGV